ncbi:hypothetical protein BST11_22065 [Mycobacterium alsense]|uniref:PE family protein n=1 Tax=Mycobacterium alsense TaxID=324058 RepID=A0AA41XTJ3_9MYCO|nr:PE family protein [Mycobacterium alsense]MCV7381781.1 PE family protein [Mycobacterium alsense]OQZ88555.1 hypothetical protein BST11_22065 [Mycobacterium alsense]
MSGVIAAPELIDAAATDLAAIGSSVDAAHLTAAAATTELMPAAADEVSTGIAQLFSTHAAGYHAQAATMAAATSSFAANLTGSAGAYISADGALASLLRELLHQYVILGSFALLPLAVLAQTSPPLGLIASAPFLVLGVPFVFSYLLLGALLATLTGT